jgi:TRAP-type C4-dicarboxylate transport system permease small subunit
MKKKITQALDCLNSVESILASLAMGTLTLMVLIDVLMRELFNLGFPALVKTAVVLMSYAGFLGVILVAHKAAHLRPKMADKLWHQFPHVFVIIQNLVMLGFNLLMLYASVTYVNETRGFGDMHVVLKIPMWIIQLIIPYSFLSMSLRNIFFIVYPDIQLLRQSQEEIT